jgi:DoxX-like family
MLNMALWIIQGFVAFVVMLAGITKLSLPREKLAKKMHWASAWPPWRIKLLGLAEIAGAVGLVLPAAMGIAPLLTPIAAACVGVLMVGAARTHRQLGEGFVPAAVIGALCIFIAAGRVATDHASSNGAAVSASAAVQP